MEVVGTDGNGLVDRIVEEWNGWMDSEWNGMDIQWNGNKQRRRRDSDLNSHGMDLEWTMWSPNFNADELKRQSWKKKARFGLPRRPAAQCRACQQFTPKRKTNM